MREEGQKNSKYSRIITPEALIWLIGLVILALSNPENKMHHTFFLPSILFDIKSPGYNLGHSISFFLNGEIVSSLKAHPLGILATLILFYRSVYLIKISYASIRIIHSRSKCNAFVKDL